jgi:hypothetical protein
MYRIQEEAGLGRSALLRWEYGHPYENEYCKHHVHVAGLSPRKELVFDDLHLPTGRVIIEDLFRFLFTDFGVQAKPNWSAVLTRSEEVFRTQLAATPW